MVATGIALLPGASLPLIGADSSQPDSMASDRWSMDMYCRDVATFLEGARAVIAASTRYLPAFAREIDSDYEVRLGCAKFTNVFRDLLDNLASKPFARTVDLAEDSKKAWPELAEFVENVDGGGNHLHVFAGDVFFNAIAFTVDWIMVDKTPIRRGASLREEQESGARVYWYRVPQTDVLAVYSDVVDGEEIFTHFRFRENAVVRDGFGEKLVERVRVFERQKSPDSTPSRPKYGGAHWTLYERLPPSVANGRAVWAAVDRGEIGLGIIPLIPVITGRREGRSWRFVKTMDDVVHLQKKMYQAETNLEYAKLMAGSPMLSGKDVDPPTVPRRVTVNGIDQIVNEPAPVVVGPKTVLYGEWGYIQIDSNALKFLADDVQRIERQLREIGRQPLTTDSGNLTVVTTMFAAQKGNSAVQAWALGLKDALERAFVLTARWKNIQNPQPEVNVWTDFSIDLESEAAPSFLLNLYSRGLISREALIAEGKRRNFLSAEYDANTDIELVVADLKKYEHIKLMLESGKASNKASGSGGATARVRADLRE